MSKDLPLIFSKILVCTWCNGSVEAVLVGTESELGGTGCYCEISENIWFTWYIPSNYGIFEEGKSVDGQMD